MGNWQKNYQLSPALTQQKCTAKLDDTVATTPLALH